MLINTNKESFLVYGEETLYVGAVRVSVGMSSFLSSGEELLGVGLSVCLRKILIFFDIEVS